MNYKKGMRYMKAEDGSYEESKDGKYMYDGKDMKETSEKSELFEDELNKSLDELAAIAGEDPATRKQELLAKAQSGDEMTDDEREELFKALGGQIEYEVEDTLAKSVNDSMTPEPGSDFDQALDVSEYLDAQHAALTKSLEAIAEGVDAQGARQHEFNLVYARAMHQMGSLVKSMSRRLGVLESAPVSGPKSKMPVPASGQTLEKGFAGEPPAEDQLSKGQILQAMEGLLHKSEDGTAPCGEDLVLATAKFEQTRMISPQLLSDVRKFRNSAH